MKQGKAFELFVKHILINIGFTEVESDDIYVIEGTSGQMVNGLGGAHNADVLLNPPAQTPFYATTRLIIECKDYDKNVGLQTVRGVLGLREDINHFSVIDKVLLKKRKQQNHKKIVVDQERYLYQVAIATTEGFTVQAQEFAATHNIPFRYCSHVNS